MSGKNSPFSVRICARFGIEVFFRLDGCLWDADSQVSRKWYAAVIWKLMAFGVDPAATTSSNAARILHDIGACMPSSAANLRSIRT